MYLNGDKTFKKRIQNSKKEYDTKKIKEIKDELTVKPFNNFNKAQSNSDVGRFSVFRGPKKLYLPRFYGLKNLVYQVLMKWKMEMT